jgi:hypothetical protein
MLAFARQPYYDQFEGNAQSFTETFSVGIDWWNPIYEPSFVYGFHLFPLMRNWLMFVATKGA